MSSNTRAPSATTPAVTGQVGVGEVDQAQAVAAERHTEAEEEQESGGAQPIGEAGAHDSGHQ